MNTLKKRIQTQLHSFDNFGDIFFFEFSIDADFNLIHSIPRDHLFF